MIVTIDGPAGAGKSTVARSLAARLGFCFLDTGAMFRVVALKCLREKVDLEDAAAVAATARSVTISFPDQRVCADEEDVTEQIRSPEVTQAASVVAMNDEVRSVLARLERQFAENADIVTEGRDQGSVVFPEAQCKFFLTADATKRAERRRLELQAQGRNVSAEEILAEIQERDHRDQTRSVAPLKPAEDAVLVDTSRMDSEAVLDRLVQVVRVQLT